jgi:cytochrome c oxidase subunit II
MRLLLACLVGSLVLTATLVLSGAALAQQPAPWQMMLQPAATPSMERIESFYNLLLVIITLICLFVLALLIYVIVKFRESKNPAPSRRTHNTLLEVVWTAVPVLILVIIAIPSFRLLYFVDVIPETDMTIKAIGRQWYWSYEYPDHDNFTFDAFMLRDDELEPGMARLLETDNRVVLPTNTNIKVQVTASDVLHAWAVPAFGVKIDAVPGRLNEIWIHINEPGVYYGQCSELCGVMHGFMPITVEAVPPEQFMAWVEEAQAMYARVDDSGTTTTTRRPAGAAGPIRPTTRTSARCTSSSRSPRG